MTFLVDAQLPPALADWLIKQEHSAEHVYDVDLRDADDIVIWNYALSIVRVRKTHRPTVEYRKT